MRIYGRYRQAGPVTVRVQASVAGAPLDRTVEFKLPEANEANPEIERMWAQKKVDRLLAEADAAGSRSPVVDEIVRLGELYSIVTEYTSFIVLENDAEYQRWAIQRRNLLRISRDRKQQTRLNEQLTKMREESLNRLMTHAADGSSADRLAANRDPGAWSPGTGDSRGRDLTPSSGPSSRHRGGGAIDPFSAALLAGLAGLGWAARRRK